MRPALDPRESCPPVEKPPISAAPAGITAPITICGADAAPDFAAQIVQARRDARRNPAQAAMLLRSWMSDRG